MEYNREKLIDQLILHEGLELKVYKDTLGIDTIGVGRNLEDRGITDGELMHMNLLREEIHTTGITEEDARFLLGNDIDIVERELLDAHPCMERLDDVRIRVLLDMAFNLGVPRLRKFKNMWAGIQEGDYIRAGDEMMDSRWANQVGARAVRLCKMMKEGE
jgi:lysozyme